MDDSVQAQLPSVQAQLPSIQAQLPAVQYRKEITKFAPKRYQKRHTIVLGKNDLWSADIVDYQAFANKNNGTRFLLCIIDVWSRFVWVFPLKTKSALSVLHCFQELHVTPKNLWSDSGKEFLNKDFKDYCKRKDINMYQTYGENKAVYVERFNRTLKEKINNHMIDNNTQKYIDVLPSIVSEYNDTRHNTTKTTPRKAYDGEAIPTQFQNQSAPREPQFAVGDFVRISRLKGVFEKGYSHKWSKEVFQISAVNSSQNPVMYQIVDQSNEPIKGKFYEEELQKTNMQSFRRVSEIIKSRTQAGVKQFLVSFDGYGKDFDRWVTQSELNKLQAKGGSFI